MLNTETTQARFALRHPHGGTVLINPPLRTWHQYDRSAALLDHGAWMPHQCAPAEGGAEYWVERGFEPVTVPAPIAPVTGPIRVWTGCTDDECGLPLFASLTDAKAYAEREFRATALEEDCGEITWEERTARTAFLGYPNSWELETEEYGGTGWQVFGVLVHPSLASALEQDRLERRGRGDDEEPEDEDAPNPNPMPEDPAVPALFAAAGTEASR